MREILCSGQAQSLEFPYPGGMAALCWSPAGERGELTVSLHYDGAYGMGEKYNAVNQKGHTAVNEVEEKFCFQGEKTYCPAPFFWTNTGFGLYAATDERTSFRFGEKAVCAELPVDCRVVLFSGMPGEIIRDYMDLFGPAKLPPKWAFGPWISANHWDSQEKVERAVAQAEEHGFPVCALVAEAWSDEATFYVFRGARYVPKPNGGAFRLEDFDFSDSPWPDPAGMVQRLHEKGIRFLLWQIPVYKKQGPDEPLNAQNELDRADAVARGLCVHNADGSPYTIPEGTLVRRLHDPRLHQPCRRGDLVFQAKLSHRDGDRRVQDRWRRVHLPGRCALCGWQLRPGRKEPLCPGVYGGLHQTSGFGSGAVQPGGLRWSAYHAYPLGWRSAVPEQRVGQRPAGGVVRCPDRHPVLGLRHRGLCRAAPHIGLVPQGLHRWPALYR